MTETTYKTLKVKLYPTDDQIDQFELSFDARRFYWNLALSLNRYLYLTSTDSEKLSGREQDFVGKFFDDAYQREVYEIATDKYPEQINEYHYLDNYKMYPIFTQFRKNHRDEWFTDKMISSTMITTVLADLHLAYQAFWRNIKQGKYDMAGEPRYKSRFNYIQSYRVMYGNNQNYPTRYDHGQFQIFLPKIKWVDAHTKRHYRGRQVKTITVSKSASGDYFASLVTICKVPSKMNVNNIENSMVGINLNYSYDNVVTTSDGQVWTMPFDKMEEWRHKADIWQSKYQRRKNRYADKVRQYNHQVKQSGHPELVEELDYMNQRSLEVARHAKNKALTKLANIRKYEYDLITSQLTRQYKVIFTPKYDIKKLMNPKAKNKTYLNDLGLGIFNILLHQKALQNNCAIIELDSKYVTMTCNHCGKVDEETFLNEKGKKIIYTKPEWVCSHCGATNQLHINAAKNIYDQGLKQLDDMDNLDELNDFVG